MTQDLTQDHMLEMLQQAQQGEPEMSTEMTEEVGEQPASASAEPHILGRQLTDLEMVLMSAAANFGEDIAVRTAVRAVKGFADRLLTIEQKYQAEIGAHKAESAALRAELAQRDIGLTGEQASDLKYIADMIRRKPGNLLADLNGLGREMMKLLGIGGLVAKGHKLTKGDKQQIVQVTAELFAGAKGALVIGRRVAIVAIVGALILGGIIVDAVLVPSPPGLGFCLPLVGGGGSHDEEVISPSCRVSSRYRRPLFDGSNTNEDTRRRMNTDSNK